ncbi:Uncharacterized protein HZ326_6454 [Fusarium oxysporum f. sp. albedinis]|nr:Uncharacterized protein HZ326_6454 [Fusarium oxysporum f. sp. albedinis]
MSARNIRSLIVLVRNSSPLFIPQVSEFWCRLKSEEEDKVLRGFHSLPSNRTTSHPVPTPPVCFEAFINRNSQPVKLTLGVL